MAMTNTNTAGVRTFLNTFFASFAFVKLSNASTMVCSRSSLYLRREEGELCERRRDAGYMTTPSIAKSYKQQDFRWPPGTPTTAITFGQQKNVLQCSCVTQQASETLIDILTARLIISWLQTRSLCRGVDNHRQKWHFMDNAEVQTPKGFLFVTAG